MLRPILEPVRPRSCPCLLIRAEPRRRRARRRAGARRRGRAQRHHGPRPSDHDRLCDRDLPGRQGLRGRPLRGPSAELLRRERRGHQRDGATRRPIPASSFRCATSRPRSCSASRRPRAASPGTTSRPPAPTTAPTAIYQIGPFPMLVGQVITSTDVRTNPNYAGGLIGFVLLKNLGQPMLSRVYYSEYPLQCPVHGTGCTMPGYWKMALSYLSKANPNSYYLAFEDWEGADQNSWQGNDGDFNDFVFTISGVTCNGGGEPCDTGDAGHLRAAASPSAQVRRRRSPASRRSCRPPRSATTSTTTATAWSTTATACAPGQRRLQQGRLTAKLRRQRVPLRARPQVRHRRALQGSRAAPARLPGRAGLPGGHLRRRLRRRHVPARPDLPARRLRRRRARACPARARVCEKGACSAACRCRACDTGQVCAMGGAARRPLRRHRLRQDDLPGRARSAARARASTRARTRSARAASACKNGMCDPAPPVTPTGQGGTTAAAASAASS